MPDNKQDKETTQEPKTGQEKGSNARGEQGSTRRSTPDKQNSEPTDGQQNQQNKIQPGGNRQRGQM
jgi:hypothetical protein